MNTALNKYIIYFPNKKRVIPSASFYSRAIKHIVKKNKKISPMLSFSVDKIAYEQ